jgi:predicted PurR-regulated permease PerM
MSQVARHETPSGSPDLRTVAKVTAVIVSVVAFGALVATLLALAGEIFLLGFLGILFAVVFDTLAKPLTRRLHMKRRYAFVLVVSVLFLALGAIALFAGEQIVTQVDQLTATSSQAYMDLKEKAQSLPPPIGGGQGAASQSGTPPDAPTVVAGAFKVASTISEIGSAFLLTVLMSLFFGYSPEDYVDAGIRLLPDHWQGRATLLAKATHADLKQWLFGQLTTMGIIGSFVFVGLMIAGVKLAPLLGLITALCNFVPYIGPFVSPIPAIFAVLGDGGPSKLPVVLGVYVAAEFLESWVITPFIQKKRSHIPPALLLFFQALMGLVAGPLGVVVSTPLLVVIMTWVRVLVIEPRDD